MDYVRRVLARIHPLWKDAFPRWAIAEGRGGTVVVSFVIRADGSVASARVARPSGIPEFDENCRQAVLRGAPFEPLPRELGPTFAWSMPFVAKNPAVRPPDPARP
nr:energy transducer TonB [Polyangium spumosum]